jgi:hypothetical protein
MVLKRTARRGKQANLTEGVVSQEKQAQIEATMVR